MTARRSEDGKQGKMEDKSSSPALPAQEVTQGAGQGKRLKLARPPPAAAGASVPRPGAPAATGFGSSRGQTAGEAGSSGSGLATATIQEPLPVDTRMLCKWSHDGEYRTARVLERAKEEPSSEWRYYVHYLDLNRRMDEWVTLEDIKADSVQLPETDGPDGEPGQRKKDKRRLEEEEEHDEEHADMDPEALREHEEFTKVKNIERIELGRYEMDTWYFSPFPSEYNDCKKLYFCEFTLHFFKRRGQLLRHLKKCKIYHPPGNEIYRKGNVCMFEVDGTKEKVYCQNLCYLAKLFLDHKTLYWDVDVFLFYVLCEVDDRGAHVVGYFSKEKVSEAGYNLACILTLPSYQRKGYGKFLIAMSYELSKIEGKVGSPERPLSDLGQVSYRGYWTRVLLSIIRDHEGSISIKDLADMTAIRTDDITNTLTHLKLIQYVKGQHVLCADPKLVDKYLKEAGGPGLEVDPSCIIFTPYNAEREFAAYKK